MDLSDLQTAGMGTEEIKNALDISNWQSELAYDRWIALPVFGSRPPARYKVIFSIIEILNKPRYIVGSSTCFAPFGASN
jgi:hypothetical protein